MNQPDGGAERYRDIQARQKAALAAAVRGHFIHRHPRITPENMTRKVRRAMARIVGDKGLPWAAKIKAAGRVLGVDPAATLAFLGDYLANAPKARAAPRVIAFNKPTTITLADGATADELEAAALAVQAMRNATKAERHRPRKPSPAEQPRRARRARHGVSP